MLDNNLLKHLPVMQSPNRTQVQVSWSASAEQTHVPLIQKRNSEVKSCEDTRLGLLKMPRAEIYCTNMGRAKQFMILSLGGTDHFLKLMNVCSTEWLHFSFSFSCTYNTAMDYSSKITPKNIYWTGDAAQRYSTCLTCMMPWVQCLTISINTKQINKCVINLLFF